MEKVPKALIWRHANHRPNYSHNRYCDICSAQIPPGEFYFKLNTVNGCERCIRRYEREYARKTQ